VIEAQLQGIISSDGFCISLSGSYEDLENNISFYTKRFSARSSEYFFKKPSLEARWESLVEDDRNNFFYSSDRLEQQDNNQNLYFFNNINGINKNLPNDASPLVKICDEEGNIIIENIQTTKVSTGIYKASLSLTGSQDTEFNDIWYSGSLNYFSGVFSCKQREEIYSADSGEYVFNIKNLKNSYTNNEFATIRIYSRKKNWSPNIFKVYNQDIESENIKNLYFKVLRIVDNMTVVDYGIEPLGYTKCSYDKFGNYFQLDMSLFEPGYSYGIKLMKKEGDILNEYSKLFKFKVI